LFLGEPVNHGHIDEDHVTSAHWLHDLHQYVHD